MEERAEFMTDYQMRMLANMFISTVNDNLSNSPEKRKLIEKLLAIRDGKLEIDETGLE